MKNALRLGAAAAVLATTTSVGVIGTTEPAQAGIACDLSWAANYAACGGAANHVVGHAFRITKAWPSSTASYLSTRASVGSQVTVGGNSTLGGPGGGGTDVDGYLINNRCQGLISIGANGTRTWQGAGWRKISDGQVVHIWQHRCEA